MQMSVDYEEAYTLIMFSEYRVRVIIQVYMSIGVLSLVYGP